MKKLLLLCLLLLLLTACTQQEAAPVNQIAHTELTQEQREIVDLLQHEELEILLFDFTAEDAYRSMSFWAEVYENGVLVTEPPSAVSTGSDEALPRSGRLAVTISHGDETGWAFTLSQDGSKVRHDGVYQRGEASLGRAYGPISEAVAIRPGEEIVLYSCIFSNGPIASYSDQQVYLEQPELLEDYPLVYLIKCKFEA